MIFKLPLFSILTVRVLLIQSYIPGHSPPKDISWLRLVTLLLTSKTSLAMTTTRLHVRMHPVNSRLKRLQLPRWQCRQGVLSSRTLLTTSVRISPLVRTNDRPLAKVGSTLAPVRQLSPNSRVVLCLKWPVTSLLSLAQITKPLASNWDEEEENGRLSLRNRLTNLLCRLRWDESLRQLPEDRPSTARFLPLTYPL